MVTVSKELQQTLQAAVAEARRRRHEYVTLEHLLHAMTKDRVASEVLLACGADLKLLEKELEEYLDRTLESLAASQDPEQTAAFQRVLQRAAWHVQGSGRTELNAGDVLVAITRERGSHAVYLLEKQGVRRLDILQYISHGVGKDGPGGDDEGQGEDQGEEGGPRPVKDPFKTFTVNLVERAAQGHIDPLIGRDAELERTIQILCRRRKNNPVLVGEPGVGKTAIVEGLALKIHQERGPRGPHEGRDLLARHGRPARRHEVPRRVRGSGSRPSSPALEEDPNAILFIDEIHTIVGAGAISGGIDGRLEHPQAGARLRRAPLHRLDDVSRSTRLPSSATARWRAASRRSRSASRRVEETIEILNGLKSYYEEHHGVQFTEEALTRRRRALREVHPRPASARQGDRRARRGGRARRQHARARRRSGKPTVHRHARDDRARGREDGEDPGAEPSPASERKRRCARSSPS